MASDNDITSIQSRSEIDYDSILELVVQPSNSLLRYPMPVRLGIEYYVACHALGHPDPQAPQDYIYDPRTCGMYLLCSFLHFMASNIFFK